MNKICACLDIPPITSTAYDRYQKEVGPAIEEAAKESCRRAVKEERKLVVEKLDELRKSL